MKKAQQKKQRNSKKRIIIAIVIAVILIVGAFIYKTGAVAGRISTADGSFFGSLFKSLPLVEKKLDGEKDGRINIALLGMRGVGVEGGGLLADTIMVVSIKPAEQKASIVSIPRDLEVQMPGGESRTKINAVHFLGEEEGSGGGLRLMKEVLREVTGQEIHYAASINFAGFTQIIDAIGGVDVTLEEPFTEPLQFHQEQVCDKNVFTVPSGNVEQKINDDGKVVAEYPLCYNKDEECGGIFRLPAGTQTLDGENALCYIRSRMTSSDFDRARRQQQTLSAAQEKLLSVGTLTSFSKVNALIDTLGDNVRTDMELWEMQAFFTLYRELADVTIEQRVLDTSKKGLLYVPEGAGEGGRGFILLPRGDNYDQIRALFEEII